jgi:hypothetical protein
MLRHPYESEQVHRQRQRELREAVRHQRLSRARRPQRRIRRLVGRSMVSIGSRLAAEPSHEGARSR